MEPGRDAFGVSLEASPTRQLLLLKPADNDFSGDWTQGSLPRSTEQREVMGELECSAEGEKGVPLRMSKHNAWWIQAHEGDSVSLGT